jgi:hypothetical protein
VHKAVVAVCHPSYPWAMSPIPEAGKRAFAVVCALFGDFATECKKLALDLAQFPPPLRDLERLDKRPETKVGSGVWKAEARETVYEL